MTNFIKIPGDCKYCFREYISGVPENCCPTCFFENEFTSLTVPLPKESKWKPIRKFLYVGFLVVIPSWVIGIKFGVKTELITFGGYLMGLFIGDILNILETIF